MPKHTFKVYTTEEEAAQIRAKASSASLSTSAFLRYAALRRKVVSVHDREAVADLMILGADLGRVGGLLKSWLAREGEASFSEVPGCDIASLLRDILETRDRLHDAIERGVVGGEGLP